jgi:hypothetical protein
MGRGSSLESQLAERDREILRLTDVLQNCRLAMTSLEAETRRLVSANIVLREENLSLRSQPTKWGAA